MGKETEKLFHAFLIAHGKKLESLGNAEAFRFWLLAFYSSRSVGFFEW